ncbi:hypothetical protein [Stutzerimonas stutzeri]|uniref:hypothetical protein n=1 Tax=Stutzerimonas stutzeri TaxID=316 RepID=UPI0005EB458B|nr:hypothetical protein [Stutzerimonas stutzeri]RRV80384.1 hypothetical protein EGI92_12425 [Stutzerimonas stutzeri]
MTTDELIEALEPFALESALWSGKVSDDREIITVSSRDDFDCEQERYMTVGDLRRLARIREQLMAEQERKAA